MKKRMLYGALIGSILLCPGMTAGDVQTLPERQEMDSAYQWRLENIFEDDASWETAYKEVQEILPRLGEYQGTLGESPTKLLECLELEDSLGIILGKVYAYAHMRSHEDTENDHYQGLADRATTLAVEANGAGSFVTPEILAIPEKTLEEFLAREPRLELYRFALEQITRVRNHVLPAEQELLLARMGGLADVPQNAFSMLTNADLKFPVIRDEEGREVELSEERYGKYIHSRNREVRKAAFMGLFKTYERYRNTLAATYGGSVKKDAFFSQVRNYESSLQGALYPDAIPLEVYDKLIQAIHEGLPELHRYMALKKEALGLEELHMYDLYAPLVEESRKDISYAEAVEDVRQALAPLGDRYLEELEKGLTGGWIDVYENRGKRSGAYSWSTYGAHPYVLLNYNGTLRDVFTLAHEMGHALHSSFTYAVQPYVYSGHDIFTAEVASITNENLLLDHMISKAASREEKLYLLNYALEQIRTTVFRQVLFGEFEKIAHEKTRRGEPLTPDVLCTLWKDLNTAYYGTETVIDPEIHIEWARIPHFYSAFYVYQYATGYAAAASLAEQILTEGEPAVARYLAFLESGDSAYPIDLLKKAGVDMTSPEPVRAVLDRFSRWLDQLEQLLRE